MLLNILASALPVAILQLVIFPGIANRLGSEANGLMLSIVALFSLISESLGNVVNNIRLLKQRDYEQAEAAGDFNRLIMISELISAAAILIGTFAYGERSAASIALSVFAAAVVLLRAYLTVYFRLKLNYRGVLVNNAIMVAGYYLGYLFFAYSGMWQLIYIFGNILSICNILRQDNLLKEPIKKTPLYSSALKDSTLLYAATLCGGSLNYFDRLMLYPLLGGTMVSVFYSATIIGKICSLGITPICSVMLSYLSKMESFQRKTFFKLLGLTSIVGIVGYFICIWLSPTVLNWLYPKWAAQSMEIIGITTLTAMLSVVSSFINPIVLRFCDIKWQLIMNAMCVAIYMVCCYEFSLSMGLKGFALGVLVSYISKLVIQIMVFLFKSQTNGTEKRKYFDKT